MYGQLISLLNKSRSRRKALFTRWRVTDTMYMSPQGLMEYRVQHVTFIKCVKDGEDIVHHARLPHTLTS